MYNSERISEIFPSVNKIIIEYKRYYSFPDLDLNDKETAKMTYEDSFACNFHIKCRNIDCTQGYFDLYSVIASMIAHKEVYKDDELKCEGREARKYNHRCPCSVKYSVTIEYK